MNSFFREIARITELPFDTAFSSYRYVNIGGAALYVQGHRGMISYSTEKVVLRLKSGRLEITGENLTIKQLTGDDIALTGKIISVSTDAPAQPL